MRGLVLIPAVLATALLAVPAAHAAYDAGVRVAECRPAPTQADRRASFEGRMATVAGAQRMQMRFTLQARASRRQKWRRVAVPGFDAWATSAAGIDRYVYTKKVANLLAPSQYRVVVDHRWLDSGGGLVGRSRTVSAPCRQPDLRPNLVPVSVEVAPGPQPAAARYRIRIRNRGPSPAAPSELALALNGQVLASEVVPALRPREVRVVEVEAPRCQPGAKLDVTVDARGAIEERNELDNLLALPCSPGS
jgi:hypothetical protein